MINTADGLTLAACQSRLLTRLSPGLVYFLCKVRSPVLAVVLTRYLMRYICGHNRSPGVTGFTCEKWVPYFENLSETRTAR